MPLKSCCTPSLFTVSSLSCFAVVATTAAAAQSSFALLLFSLSCVAVVAGAGSKVKHSQARRVQSVLYECGPWANCPDGAACCQAASQQVTFNGCDKNVYAFWLVMS